MKTANVKSLQEQLKTGNIPPLDETTSASEAGVLGAAMPLFSVGSRVWFPHEGQHAFVTRVKNRMYDATFDGGQLDYFVEAALAESLTHCFDWEPKKREKKRTCKKDKTVRMNTAFP